MILENFFIRKKTLTPADIAKTRLHIVISKENKKKEATSHNLISLKNDLIQVIKKHMHEPKDILIQFKKQDEYTSILECDIYFLNKDT